MIIQSPIEIVAVAVYSLDLLKVITRLRCRETRKKSNDNKLILLFYATVLGGVPEKNNLLSNLIYSYTQR